MCNVIGIGTDLCRIDRMEKAMTRPGFEGRICTPDECAYLRAQGKTAPQSAAAMFAAKEAAAKALGTGFSCGVLPALIEVTHDSLGAPGLLLHGAARARFEQMGGGRILLSLSHEGDMAVAFVVIAGRDKAAARSRADSD